MSNILITYFSASGVTARVSQNIADKIGADTFEIRPKKRYTDADLNWHDKNSRSSIEMENKSSRPEIEVTVSKLTDYSIIMIGFPVWWYTAPTIINTFIESLDLTGKILIPFCTSGGTGIE
ncbi:MAG: NAD(P)H-dependent oxidoreductase, partial [Bacteroidetes bacterium]|nr:NAD(P)H-dependent oxidoreductase [Bacteroidota bacterium]